MRQAPARGPLVPDGKASAAVAVRESVLCYSRGKLLAWHISVPETCCNPQFYAQQCATHEMFCPINALLWAKIGSCSNTISYSNAFLVHTAHVWCTPRVHHGRQQRNMHPLVCNSAAQHTALTHRICMNYTAL